MIHWRCTWREAGRWITPRLTSIDKMACSEYMAERLLLGVTVIELRCTVCGDIKSVELLGSQAT